MRLRTGSWTGHVTRRRKSPGLFSMHSFLAARTLPSTLLASCDRKNMPSIFAKFHVDLYKLRIVPALSAAAWTNPHAQNVRLSGCRPDRDHSSHAHTSLITPPVYTPCLTSLASCMATWSLLACHSTELLSLTNPDKIIAFASVLDLSSHFGSALCVCVC